MPKTNSKGGKKHKRGKRGGPIQATTLRYKDPTENEEYAKVLKPLGDCRLSIQIVGAKQGSHFYGKDTPIICKIPGSFRKRVFMNKGDYILVSTREFQQDRVDAMCKYNGNEAKRLMKQGEIPYDDLDEDGEDGDLEIEWMTDEPDQDQKMGDKKGSEKKERDEDWRKQWLPPSDDEAEEGEKAIGMINPNNRGAAIQDKPVSETDKQDWTKDDGSIDLEDL